MISYSEITLTSQALITDFNGILEMEFAGRGGGWTEVTDWLRRPGIFWNRGLPGIGPLDCVAEIGELHFTLDNSTNNSAGLLGYYSPDHANKRANFGLNIGVRYRIDTTVRFTGVMDSIQPIPGKHGPRRVVCTAVDWMDVAQRTRLKNLPVLVNNTGDEVFQELIDSLSPILKPLAVEKDLSPDTFPYTLDHTRDEQTVLRDELYRLSVSGLSKIWVRGNGTLVYESRTRRSALSNAPADTFVDHHGFQATRDRGGVINRVQTTVHPRLPSASTVVMYSLVQPVALVPGSPLTILGPWADPSNPNVRVGAVDLTSLTATTDYTANTLADGTGADLTGSLTVTAGLSGNATEFTITLGGGTAGFLTKLQQRGKPLYDYGQTVLQWEDSPSIGQYGLNQQSVNMPYQADPRFGLEVAQFIVYGLAHPTTEVSGFTRVVDMRNDPIELARTIGRGISDLIAISDVVTGLSKRYFINGIEESEVEGVLTTSWLLTPADQTAYWLLEVPGRTELGTTTRLGFGLIVGHTDVAHGDVHGDVAHSDTAHNDAHGDVTHQDIAHGDQAYTDTAHTDVSHGDAAHADASHSDVAHVDSAHQDAHGDVAHQDVAHADSSHYDLYEDVAHGDSAHVDITHDDSHSDIVHDDYHEDYSEYFDHGDAEMVHQDTLEHGDIHHDITHQDTHNDTAHSDVAHSDVLHDDTYGDIAHGDVTHVDGAHTDTHTDVSHSDVTHVDVGHSDAAHSDVAHQDVAHVDSAHNDVAHVDGPAHTDTHTDVSHSDIVHSDAHTDTAHGDAN